ncbi:hypothetical protein Poli38472_002904 [Pythium oligandrum]|uniref:EF-hand domain-containing protein n=1 Tax=Pythium oligandrum TaxID=41045 RepID=A0A8K1C5K5_PYTOL|nr:hypothetical protein Poli38472_002904 [Pythium oligandrum]|eukprot:TMW56979.1 hypothetical protein Poli38472_002904 [Pythium oligandrum]
MHRSAGPHTRSSPQLNTAPVSKKDAQRALATSISASLLPAHEEENEDTRPQLSFQITDLLHDSPSKQWQTRKRSKPGASFGESSSGLAPLSPVRVGSDENNAKRSQNDSYVSQLTVAESPELFNYASALCYRITGRYMAREVLQRDPAAQKQEIARIQRDPELVQAIDVIRTLSQQFKQVAQDTLGHRKELGHTLLRIEESYLKLFEKLLEISLRMYWRYESENDAERRADKSAIQHWQEMYQWQLGETTKLQKLLEGKEILLKTQQIELQDLERQCREYRREIGDQRALEDEFRALKLNETTLIERERQLEAKLTDLQHKHDELIFYQREQQEEAREQHKRLMDEMKHVGPPLRDKERLLTQREKAIRELTVLTTPVDKSTAAAQTEVDDDGLWDVRDGVPRFVAKPVWHRMLWRRFDAFVRCKNCHGRPIAHTKGAKLKDPERDQDYIDVWSLTRGERHTKKAIKRIDAIEVEWELPDAIVLFLSNLPKSVVASPFYSLSHVIEQIEAIYDDKFVSDQADEADGVAREELPNFVCEYFLKTHGLRQRAEIGLYRFLISVKHSYRSHSHVHLFARFCHLLRAEDDAGVDSSSSSMPASELISMLLQKPRRSYLNRGFLRVFLHARYFLLRRPPPKPSKLKVVENLPLDHLIHVDPTKKWVPLDHAVSIIRWYLSFLSEEAVISYCREVEYSTAIYAGHALTEVSGIRLAVRAEMRKAMLANAGDAQVALSEKERRLQPRIVADVHKVLLLLLHALEQRKGVMDKALITLFDAGDANHDCVLSLDEFKAIIRMRMPGFSDRRILRMFREALMGSSDQSFALSMEAFIHVCNDHGLVTMLPDDRWNDPFLALPAPVEANKPPTKLVAALKALASQKQLPEVVYKANDDTEDDQARNTELHEAIPEELPALTSDVPAISSSRAEEVVEDEALWEW